MLSQITRSKFTKKRQWKEDSVRSVTRKVPSQQLGCIGQNATVSMMLVELKQSITIIIGRHDFKQVFTDRANNEMYNTDEGQQVFWGSKWGGYASASLGFDPNFPVHP